MSSPFQAPSGLFRLLRLRRFRRRNCPKTSVNAGSVHADPTAIAAGKRKPPRSSSTACCRRFARVAELAPICDWSWGQEWPGTRRYVTGSGLLYAAFAARSGRRTARPRPTQITAAQAHKISQCFSRRAVDMPVKEPPVTTTVAIPGAKVEEAGNTGGDLYGSSLQCSTVYGCRRRSSSEPTNTA